MKLSQYTLNLLEDIENRINPEVEDDFVNQWKKFWNNEITEIVFTPKRKVVSAPNIELQDININDAIDDYEMMLDMQLAGVSRALNSSVEALSMRANYGTGIMTSLFGAEIFKMSREHNTLPTTKSFNNTDDIRKIVDGGMPKLDNAFGKRFLILAKCVWMYLPIILKYQNMYLCITLIPRDHSI